MKIHIVIETPLISAAQFPAITSISKQYADLVSHDWTIPAQEISIGYDQDPTAWLNVIVGDKHFFPVRVLGEHMAADASGGAMAYVSAHRTLLRAGAPFGYIVRGRKSIITGKVTPESYTSGSFMEVLTHEIGEAMVDPKINRYALDTVKNHLWLVEIGDQAHGYLFTLSHTDPKTGAITRGICADYTLPSFYVDGSPAPHSHSGKVSAALTLDAGCYARILDAVSKQIISSGTDTN